MDEYNVRELSDAVRGLVARVETHQFILKELINEIDDISGVMNDTDASESVARDALVTMTYRIKNAVCPEEAEEEGCSMEEIVENFVLEDGIEEHGVFEDMEIEIED